MKNIQSDYSVYILFKSLKCCSAKISKKYLLFSLSFMSNSLGTHGLQHTKLPCPSPSPRVYSNPCPKLKLMNLLRVCSNSCLNSEGEVVVPEVCGQSSCQTHGADRRKHFPSFFLVYLGPFPPHSHCGLSLERVMSPFCSVTCGQTVYLLCQKGHTVPVLRCHCFLCFCHLCHCQFHHHTPCLAAPSMVQSINCKSTDR